MIEKVQILDFVFDSQNMFANQISVKSAREVVRTKEINLELIGDLLELARKNKGFKLPSELLLIIDKFDAKNEIGVVEYIRSVTNTISCSPSLNVSQKYNLLQLNSYGSKIKLLFEYIHTIGQQMNLEDEINLILKSNLDRQQTEFILKEKIKAIRKKLGEDSKYEDEIDDLIKSEQGKIIFPSEVAKTIARESNRLKSMVATSPESNITKTYLDLLVGLP